MDSWFSVHLEKQFYNLQLQNIWCLCVGLIYFVVLQWNGNKYLKRSNIKQYNVFTFEMSLITLTEWKQWNYKTLFFLNSRQFWGERLFFNVPLIISTRIPSQNSTQYQWLLRSSNTLHFRPLGGQSLSGGSLQCERDFRPFSIRRKITSIPPLELSLLIQPWVLLRLMFLGWYSVPLFLVRTCWYCHAGCWKTPEPSACEDSSPHLEIGGAADLGTIQLLNSLK